MAYYYSPSLPGFVNSEIWGTIPTDAISISDEKYRELLYGLHDGYAIEIDNGVLTLTTERRIVLPTWERIRSLRESKLSACDWTQLADVAMDEATVMEWRTYRQALRDLTETYSDPRDVVWPTEPS